MSEKNINNRDIIANKLAIVNKIIKNGYELAIKDNRAIYYSKNSDFFSIREKLMSELYPLVYSY